jgi:hypothetical protein
MLQNGEFALRAAMARETGMPGNAFPRQGNTATGIAIVAAIRVFASRCPIREELSLRAIRTATSVVKLMSNIGCRVSLEHCISRHGGV